MIYVLIPAHNEAPTVGLLLWKVRQFFTSFNREYQLVVVNDGSTDATEEILAPYTRALPLTLITHRKRQGYARSLEALLREAVRRTDRPRRDLVITMQADFSESPEDALELIKRLEGGADIVVADRRQRQGAHWTESAARRWLPKLVRRKLGIVGAEDVVGTMRGYRLATIERLVRDAGRQPFLGCQGWAADLELLARAGRHARTVASVEIRTARPESARPSRLHPLREAWRTWRAAAALTGLPMPALSPPEAAEPAPAPVVSRPPKDRGERERSEREHGASRGERPPRSEQPRRPRNERRPAKDKQRPPQGRRPATPAVSAVADPVAVAVTPAANPATAAALPSEGGAKRKRRRRGRGRGRGRGQTPGGPGQDQGPGDQAQQQPPAPPAA
jgi:hypothetical protein